MKPPPSTLVAPNSYLKRLGWIMVVVLASSVSLASCRYFAGGVTMAPPPLRANFISHTVLFYGHISAASTALIVGPWQFFGALRRRYPVVHRTMGVLYATACLVGGVTAFPIALGSTAGPIGAAGFVTLAMLWLWTTGQAVIAVASGDIATHRRWVVRSFALTLAAVTLRSYLPVAVFGPFGFHNTYAAIAWLCWAPNLILAESLIRSNRSR